jgi:hypothetical protein
MQSPWRRFQVSTGHQYTALARNPFSSSPRLTADAVAKSAESWPHESILRSASHTTDWRRTDNCCASPYCWTPRRARFIIISVRHRSPLRHTQARRHWCVPHTFFLINLKLWYGTGKGDGLSKAEHIELSPSSPILTAIFEHFIHSLKFLRDQSLINVELK